jgi:hypothetical protein
MARHSVGISPTVSLISASALWAIATVISKKLLTSVVYATSRAMLGPLQDCLRRKNSLQCAGAGHGSPPQRATL